MAARPRRGVALPGAGLLLLVLTNPSLVEEQRQPQHDVAVVVVDDSPSMRIGERRHFADAALQHVTDRAAAVPRSRCARGACRSARPGTALADNGTQLYTALTRALADVPRQRVAGAVMITDGEVHDMPPADRLALSAPLHVLLTGQPGEADRGW